jgi:hypothetical protein
MFFMLLRVYNLINRILLIKGIMKKCLILYKSYKVKIILVLMILIRMRKIQRNIFLNYFV